MTTKTEEHLYVCSDPRRFDPIPVGSETWADVLKTQCELHAASAAEGDVLYVARRSFLEATTTRGGSNVEIFEWTITCCLIRRSTEGWHPLQIGR